MAGSREIVPREGRSHGFLSFVELKAPDLRFFRLECRCMWGRVGLVSLSLGCRFLVLTESWVRSDAGLKAFGSTSSRASKVSVEVSVAICCVRLTNRAR